MKIDFTELLNKVNVYIKTNGKREITASQLKEVLVDLIGETSELQLMNGPAVSSIFDSEMIRLDGVTPGDDQLLTFKAVVELITSAITLTDEYNGNLEGLEVNNLKELAIAVDNLIISPPSIRHDNTGGYDYVGTAEYGSPEDSYKWTITRIQVQNDGTTNKAIARGAKWTDRLTANYI